MSLRRAVKRAIIALVCAATVSAVNPLSAHAGGTPPVAKDGTASVAARTWVYLYADKAESYSVVTPPAHGSLTQCGHRCLYTADPGYVGPDSFTWKVNDGESDSNVATVTLTVTENHPPVAESSEHETALPFEVSLRASDADRDVLSFEILTQPMHGTLTNCRLFDSGYCTYTPDDGYRGEDLFTWKASDGNDESSVATYTLTVVPNRAPVATSSSVTGANNFAVSLTASDADDDSLTREIVTPPRHGVVTDCSGANCRYVAAPGFVGEDSFTWKANDGQSDSNVATMTITVTPNTPPTAADAALPVSGPSAVPFEINHRALATDVDRNPLTYTLVNPPAHGTMDTAATPWLYTPDPAYGGNDSFTWKANDGLADSNVALYTLHVSPVGSLANVPDVGLRRCMTDALGLPPTADLHQGKLATITQLTNCGSTGAPVTDLSGLENLIHLDRLSLAWHNVADFSKLTQLPNLTRFSLLNNEGLQSGGAPMDTIGKLTRLKHLGLINGLVTDLSKFSALTELVSLQLDRNALTDLGPLRSLSKLQTLLLSDTGISDVSALSGLTDLWELDLSANHLTDLSSPWILFPWARPR